MILELVFAFRVFMERLRTTSPRVAALTLLITVELVKITGLLRLNCGLVPLVRDCAKLLRRTCSFRRVWVLIKIKLEIPQLKQMTVKLYKLYCVENLLFHLLDLLNVGSNDNVSIFS